ncbi:hypothetical protein EHM69_11760 [candidate division KSB1 bacterium]|nr:MAG: hypothetical protein EHM69_11760 [candidate division KSB1 bacterium]
MSWISEFIHHRRCLRHQKHIKPLELPRPLDLLVFVYDGADMLREYFDSVIRNTRWPLRIHLCDAIFSDNSARELMKLWNGKKAGIHEVRSFYKLSRNYPETISTALRGIQSDVFLVSESRIAVPSLPDDCWATRLLKTMERYPHVGWLNAALSLPAFPDTQAAARKPVRGTNDTVLRDSLRTQLALIRSDYLDRNANGELLLNKTYYEHTSSHYHTGCSTDVTVSVKISIPDKTERKQVEYGLPFYIITRTHARPEFFARCRNSIERQTSFDRIIHIVTYEDEKDLTYIPADCAKVKVTPQLSVPCWYETYVNEALDTISGPGLVMFLDDDDYIVNGNFVESAITAAAECGVLFFRTALRTDRRIPAVLPFAAPPYGDVASCSYVLRTETAKQARWESGHAGDFRYLNQIFYSEIVCRQRIGWCPDALTSTQQGRNMGRSAARTKPLKYRDDPILFYRADSAQRLVPIK